MKMFKRIISIIMFILVLGLFVCAPILIGLYNLYFFNCVIIYSIILLLVYIVYKAINKEKYQFRKIDWFILLFPLIYLLPLLFYSVPTFADTYRHLAKYFCFVVIVFIMKNYLKDKKNLFLKLLALSSVVVAIFTCLSIFFPKILSFINLSMKYGDYSENSIYRTYSTFVYPNTVSLYSCLGIFSSLYLTFNDKKIYSLGLFPLFFAFLCGMSNMITYMFIVINIAVLIYYLVKKEKQKVYKIIYIYLLLIPLGVYLLNQTRSIYFGGNSIHFIIDLVVATALFQGAFYAVDHINNYRKTILIVLIFINGGLVLFNKAIPLTISTTKKINSIRLVDLYDLDITHNYKLTMDIENGSSTDNSGIVVMNYTKTNGVVKKLAIASKKIDSSIELVLKPMKNTAYLSITAMNLSANNKYKIDNVVLEDTDINRKVNLDLNYSYLPIYYVNQTNEITTTTKENESSAASRFQYYKDSLELFKKSPIFGQGVDVFRRNTLLTGASHRAIEEHSHWFKLLNENGIVGVIYFLGIIMYGTYLLIRNLKNEKSLFYGAMYVLIMGSATFDFTLSYGIIFILLFVIILLNNEMNVDNPKPFFMTVKRLLEKGKSTV